MLQSDVNKRSSAETIIGEEELKSVEPVVLPTERPTVQDTVTQTDPPNVATSSSPAPASASAAGEGSRAEWSRIKDHLGFSEEEEKPMELVHACLVLLTTPFMLLHGVFKMSGAFLRSLGMIFTVLGNLAKKCTYKPKKRVRRRLEHGPHQV